MRWKPSSVPWTTKWPGPFWGVVGVFAGDGLCFVCASLSAREKIDDVGSDFQAGRA